MLWTGSGNGHNGSSGRLVNHEEGKGKGKTPPPAASKEPHAAANCRRIQPRRSLRVGASGGGVGSVVGAPVGASVSLRTPLREHFHGLARNVADRLDVRTDHAEDVAAQMHAVGDAVTADSLAGAVRRLRFED